MFVSTRASEQKKKTFDARDTFDRFKAAAEQSSDAVDQASDGKRAGNKRERGKKARVRAGNCSDQKSSSNTFAEEMQLLFDQGADHISSTGAEALSISSVEALYEQLSVGGRFVRNSHLTILVLGSGLGEEWIMLSKMFKRDRNVTMKVIAYEIKENLVLFARNKAKAHGVDDLVSFRHGNIALLKKKDFEAELPSIIYSNIARSDPVLRLKLHELCLECKSFVRFLVTAKSNLVQEDDGDDDEGDDGDDDEGDDADGVNEAEQLRRAEEKAFVYCFSSAPDLFQGKLFRSSSKVTYCCMDLSSIEDSRAAKMVTQIRKKIIEEILQLEARYFNLTSTFWNEVEEKVSKAFSKDGTTIFTESTKRPFLRVANPFSENDEHPFCFSLKEVRELCEKNKNDKHEVKMEIRQLAMKAFKLYRDEHPYVIDQVRIENDVVNDQNHYLAGAFVADVQRLSGAVEKEDKLVDDSDAGEEEGDGNGDDSDAEEKKGDGTDEDSYAGEEESDGNGDDSDAEEDDVNDEIDMVQSQGTQASDATKTSHSGEERGVNAVRAAENLKEAPTSKKRPLTIGEPSSTALSVQEEGAAEGAANCAEASAGNKRKMDCSTIVCERRLKMSKVYNHGDDEIESVVATASRAFSSSKERVKLQVPPGMEGCSPGEPELTSAFMQILAGFIHRRVHDEINLRSQAVLYMGIMKKMEFAKTEKNWMDLLATVGLAVKAENWKDPRGDRNVWIRNPYVQTWIKWEEQARDDKNTANGNIQARETVLQLITSTGMIVEGIGEQAEKDDGADFNRKAILKHNKNMARRISAEVVHVGQLLFAIEKRMHFGNDDDEEDLQQVQEFQNMMTPEVLDFFKAHLMQSARDSCNVDFKGRIQDVNVGDNKKVKFIQQITRPPADRKKQSERSASTGVDVLNSTINKGDDNTVKILNTNEAAGRISGLTSPTPSVVLANEGESFSSPEKFSSPESFSDSQADADSSDAKSFGKAVAGIEVHSASSDSTPYHSTKTPLSDRANAFLDSLAKRFCLDKGWDGDYPKTPGVTSEVLGIRLHFPVFQRKKRPDWTRQCFARAISFFWRSLGKEASQLHDYFSKPPDYAKISTVLVYERLFRNLDKDAAYESVKGDGLCFYRLLFAAAGRQKHKFKEEDARQHKMDGKGKACDPLFVKYLELLKDKALEDEPLPSSEMTPPSGRELQVKMDMAIQKARLGSRLEMVLYMIKQDIKSFPSAVWGNSSYIRVFTKAIYHFVPSTLCRHNKFPEAKAGQWMGVSNVSQGTEPKLSLTMSYDNAYHIVCLEDLFGMANRPNFSTYSQAHFYFLPSKSVEEEVEALVTMLSEFSVVIKKEVEKLAAEENVVEVLEDIMKELEGGAVGGSDALIEDEIRSAEEEIRMLNQKIAKLKNGRN